MSYSSLNFVLRKTPNLLCERVQAFIALTMNEPNVGCIKVLRPLHFQRQQGLDHQRLAGRKHPDDLHQDFHLENFPVER